MASDDYYTHLARKATLQRLDANKRKLGRSRGSQGQCDYETAGTAVQEMADIEAKKQQIVTLHRSMSPAEPPAPVELTPEEKAAKPWEQMDWADGLETRPTRNTGPKHSIQRSECHGDSATSWAEPGRMIMYETIPVTSLPR